MSDKNKKEEERTYMTVSEANQIVTLADGIAARAKIAHRLGQSGFGNIRDIYEALGYIKELTFSHYYARFKRQGVAKRIVIAMPNACWQKHPTIVESSGEETSFEGEWNKLQRELSIYSYLRRVDKLSGIGRYGVLFLGFNDTSTKEELKNEVNKGASLKLGYMRAFTEENSKISRWDNNASSDNYGQPEEYNLQIRSGGFTSSVKVHRSRVIHIAEDLIESEVYGEPVLEPVYNYLQDLELVSGSSGEMWWQSAFPGLMFNIDADAEAGAPTLESMKGEIDNYIHKLQRFLRLQGVDVKNLAPKMPDPKKYMELFYTLISTTKEIPMRMLLGSEKGEMSSSQDSSMWNDKVDSRRTNYVTPHILEKLINRLIKYEVLREPKEYIVEWPDLYAPSDKEVAEITVKRTEALAKYASTPGIENVIPLRTYLKKYHGYTDTEIDEMEAMVQQQKEDEEVDENEEAELEKEKETGDGE